MQVEAIERVIVYERDGIDTGQRQRRGQRAVRRG